jgi:tetratricopeptide (TPR) repeat protein
MTFKWTSTASVFITIQLAVSACAGSIEPSPTSTPKPEPTATATLTPTPRPTATPSPTPGPGLAQLLSTPIVLAANADLVGAEASYRDLAALYPDSAEPWLGLAALALRQSDPDTALIYLESAADADPTSREALRQWAVVLEQQNRYDSLVDVYSRVIELTPDDPNAFMARSEAYARIGNADLAIVDLETTQRLDPNREYAWQNVAGAAYGAREYETARVIATIGLEHYADSSGLLTTRALTLICLSQPDEALDDLDSVIDLRPVDPNAYHWKGRLLLEQGDYGQAAEILTQAADLGIKSGVSGVNQGYESMSYAADAMARTDINAAFAYLADQVIQFGSRDGLMMGYGLVRWRQGNIPLALGRMDDLVQTGFVSGLYWRGVIKSETGDPEGAVADLEAYVKLRNFGPEAEKARALIGQLTK